MMEFAVLLLILGALALVVGPRLMRRRGPRGEVAQGTLLVTGVSPRPEAVGEEFVTRRRWPQRCEWIQCGWIKNRANLVGGRLLWGFWLAIGQLLSR